MAKKGGFAKAQASVLKAIRNFEETVAGMVGFDEPEKKKAKRKTKKRKTKARGANGDKQAHGDNARKGAVKNRTQLKTKVIGEEKWTKRSLRF